MSTTQCKTVAVIGRIAEEAQRNSGIFEINLRLLAIC